MLNYRYLLPSCPLLFLKSESLTLNADHDYRTNEKQQLKPLLSLPSLRLRRQKLLGSEPTKPRRPLG